MYCLNVCIVLVGVWGLIEADCYTWLWMCIYLSIYPADKVFAFMHRFWNSWCWCREVDDTTRDCSVHRRQEGCLWMSINNHCEFTSLQLFRLNLIMNTCLFFFIQIKIILSEDKDHGACVMNCLCSCCSSSFFILFVFRYMFKSVLII